MSEQSLFIGAVDCHTLRTAAVRAWVEARFGREHFLLGAATALSWGLMLNIGTFSRAALSLVVLALILTAIGLRLQGPSASWLVRSCAVALTAAGGLSYGSWFGAPAELGLAGLLVIATVAVILSSKPWVSWVGTIGAVGALIAMVVVPWQWRSSSIDLFAGLQNASEALLRGQDPYTQTFHAVSQTAPGIFVERLIHFPYLPGAALLAVPGRIVGDARVMSVVAFAALFYFVLRLSRDSPLQHGRGRMILALCLAAPTTVAMVHWAWLDIYSVAGFAGWLAFRRSHSRWAIVLLAISLTIKPYILLALAPMWFWSTRVRRETLLAGLGAVAVIAPFVVMSGVRAFYEDVVGVFGTLGFRFDGLTLSAGWYQLTGSMVPFAVSIALGLGLALLSLWRRPKDLADPLVAAALLSIGAFLLAKWAFLNYYFIPEWLLLLALAARGVQFDAESDVRVPWPPSRLLDGRRLSGRIRAAPGRVRATR